MYYIYRKLQRKTYNSKVDVFYFIGVLNPDPNRIRMSYNHSKVNSKTN